MPRRFTPILLTVLLVSSATAFADRVVLTDGTTLTGRVLEQDEKMVRIRTEREEWVLPRGLVETVVAKDRLPEGKPANPSGRLSAEARALADAAARRLADEDLVVRSSAAAVLRTMGIAADALLRLTAELGLSDYQQEKVRGILPESAKRMGGIRKVYGGFRSQLREILTDVQTKKLEQLLGAR